MDSTYYISLICYTSGILFVVTSIFFAHKDTWISLTKYKKGSILSGSFICIAILLYVTTQTKILFQNTPQNTTWIIQATSAYIMLFITTIFIIKFFFQYQSIVALLFYGSSICFVLIAGRILFLNLINMASMLPEQLYMDINTHIRFLFFVMSNFFISIALFHILTKTRFLLFLPDKLLPVSAMLTTSLEAAYSLTILL